MDFESTLQCPKCGGPVKVVLKSYEEGMSGIENFLDDLLGHYETNHFCGNVKCACGKTVFSSLHVTARDDV